MEAPNILILDEPTNDLDIQTLAILEDYLEKFPGILITVSHDRYFLDKVVDRIFAFETGGFLRQYEGGYSDYLEAKKQWEEPETTAKPKKDASEKTEKVRQKKLKFTWQEQKDYDDEIRRIIACVHEYGEKYGVHIPVITAGGVMNARQVQHAFALGAEGVQVATPFVTSEECDAAPAYKQAYVNAKKEDIEIVTSPVGMPDRKSTRLNSSH